MGILMLSLGTSENVITCDVLLSFDCHIYLLDNVTLDMCRDESHCSLLVCLYVMLFFFKIKSLHMDVSRSFLSYYSLLFSDGKKKKKQRTDVGRATRVYQGYQGWDKNICHDIKQEMKRSRVARRNQILCVRPSLKTDCCLLNLWVWKSEKLFIPSRPLRRP